jgi:hypothetical protein
MLIQADTLNELKKLSTKLTGQSLVEYRDMIKKFENGTADIDEIEKAKQVAEKYKPSMLAEFDLLTPPPVCYS